MPPDERRVTFKGAATELSKNEFLLLKYFLENTGKILTRDEIIKTVWGEGLLHRGQQRRCLRAAPADKIRETMVKTVCGMGYIMQDAP